MRKTLLEIVSSIASSMESDEINDISESTEALQITDIVENTFYSLAVTLNLPEHKGPVKLDAVGGPTKPTKMQLPSSVIDLEWLKYDCKGVSDPFPNMQDIRYVPFEEFMNGIFAVLPSEADTTWGSFTDTVNGKSFTFWYRNDKEPQTYTTYNDNIVVFDSYDVGVDANLQESKTFGFGRLLPSFTRSNTFIPPIDPEKFPLFYETCKVACFEDLKQMQNQTAAQRARRHLIQTQNDKRNIGDKKGYGHYTDGLPNFGRKY